MDDLTYEQWDDLVKCSFFGQECWTWDDTEECGYYVTDCAAETSDDCFYDLCQDFE